MIEDLVQEYDVDWLCQLFGLPRSTYYYQPTRMADDPELVQAIEALLADKPYLGYRMKEEADKLINTPVYRWQ